MPIPTAITDLSTTAASNYPAGTEAPNVIDDTLRAHAAFIAQLRDGPVTLAAGSVSAPAYAFAGDANNGWYAPSADTQAWSLGGAEAMRLSSTGLGLGIAPAVAFHVSAPTDEVSRFATASATGNPFVSLYKSSTRVGYFAHDNTGNSIGLMNDAAGAFRLGTNSVFRWDVGSSGNFAPALTGTYNIGSGALEVLNFIGRGLERQSAGGLQINASNAAGTVQVRTAGAAAADWDANQNLIQKLNGTAPSLSTNSTMTFELTSNTSLKVFVRGSDGVTRSVTLTLA
jgi:hypothetical protein